MSRQRVSTEAQFLKKTRRIPSGPYVFGVSRSERADYASLKMILMVGTRESTERGDEGIGLKSPKLELEVNF